MNIAFFGTPTIAKIVLAELEQKGLVPNLIISNPDAPVGRKQILTPPPVAEWAKEKGIDLFQPASLKNADDLKNITNQKWDLFIVVAYGKILPAWLLELPEHGTINVHPSLLPKLRGASPIRSAILNNEKETGVTIMLMDAEMDHGPILAQEATNIADSDWPIDGQVLDDIMAHQGGVLLADTVTKYLAGEIEPIVQNHEAATFCTKITKDMAELQIDPYNLPVDKEAYDNLLKIRAFTGWPEAYFIYEGKRIKIKEATLDEIGKLKITRIIPEGKKEMDFNSFFK